MFKMQIYYFSSFIPASELAPFDIVYANQGSKYTNRLLIISSKASVFKSSKFEHSKYFYGVWITKCYCYDIRNSCSILCQLWGTGQYLLGGDHSVMLTGRGKGDINPWASPSPRIWWSPLLETPPSLSDKWRHYIKGRESIVRERDRAQPHSQRASGASSVGGWN